MNTKRIKSIIGLFLLTISVFGQNNVIELQELDLSKVQQGWSTVHINCNLGNTALAINKVIFEKGISTHALSEIEIVLNRTGTRFSALVGIDDKVAAVNGGSVNFIVKGDADTLYQSGVMHSNQPAKLIDVSLKGVKVLTLITHDTFDGTHHDHGDWVNTKIEYTGNTKPYAYYVENEPFYNLTPKVSDFPRINGSKISAARPGSPFIYRIPVTGLKPLKISLKNLPEGLNFNEESHVITGKIETKGKYIFTITATNSKGTTSKNHKIVIGDNLALTPPMGWNSWNVWGGTITEDKIRAAIDNMESSGLADHGWTYVNIDDFWEGDKREQDSTLMWGRNFKDIKLLADYTHQKGLKLGIYSSPGDFTCGGKLSSLFFEAKDAQTWCDWGIDYLKYDLCSYSKVMPNTSHVENIKPYLKMNAELKKCSRDILFSFCQYGQDNVWKWGKQAGGSMWRISDDIIDTWHSMRRIGFVNSKDLYIFASPGGWNDPDMMVVGKLGWGSNMRSTRLTCNEQYTHVTQWVMLAAPLILGCDLAQLDDFTLNLLSNDEVIEINQDMLGKQARQVFKAGDVEIWEKELENNQQAIAIYNLGSCASEITVEFEKIGLKPFVTLRDAWQQKNLGKFKKKYSATIPRHGCKLLRVTN